ncbi:MAG: hypothetical protein IJE05_00125 [Clostridia bacterium]|nr:hypothetical protein [Clostridia bacterium]
MVRKEGNFTYDISKFEKEAERLFPNENIIVGAMDGADEELIQKFFDDVLEYEKAEKNLNDRKK